jgi:hypothetical protein
MLNVVRRDFLRLHITRFVVSSHLGKIGYARRVRNHGSEHRFGHAFDPGFDHGRVLRTLKGTGA